MGGACFSGGFLRSAAPLGGARGSVSQASAHRVCPWSQLEGVRLRQWGGKRFTWARGCFATASPCSGLPLPWFPLLRFQFTVSPASCWASLQVGPEHSRWCHFACTSPCSYWGVSMCLPDPSLGRACSLPGSVLTPGEGRAPWSHLWPAGAHRTKVPGREHQAFVWTHVSTMLPLKPSSMAPWKPVH